MSNFDWTRASTGPIELYLSFVHFFILIGLTYLIPLIKYDIESSHEIVYKWLISSI